MEYLGESHLFSDYQVGSVLLHLRLDGEPLLVGLYFVHSSHVIDQFPQIKLARRQWQLALLDLLQVVQVSAVHALLVVIIDNLINRVL